MHAPVGCAGALEGGDTSGAGRAGCVGCILKCWVWAKQKVRSRKFARDCVQTVKMQTQAVRMPPAVSVEQSSLLRLPRLPADSCAAHSRLAPQRKGTALEVMHWLYACLRANRADKSRPWPAYESVTVVHVAWGRFEAILAALPRRVTAARMGSNLSLCFQNGAMLLAL